MYMAKENMFNIVTMLERFTKILKLKKLNLIYIRQSYIKRRMVHKNINWLISSTY